MSIAVVITDRNTDALCNLLRKKLPDVTIQQWPDICQPETVELIVLWAHPEGVTKNMKNLQMVVSMGAGMDHIEADMTLPVEVVKKRIVTLALQQNMAQYVIGYILNFHRHISSYQSQQLKQKWHILESDELTPTVGFLGLGKLGTYVADQCRSLGFKTMAWTATQMHHLHPCFHDQAGLKHVCQNSDYLVVLLPLSEQTESIINHQTLSWCHQNTLLINVGRGGHVNEMDLLDALDQGVIKHAVLDVFRQEPLPAEHLFWHHPKITLTPHSSSRSDVVQTAEQIVDYYIQISDSSY